MSVQAIVAIYVIVMSWRHFWFSFMLIPAFVAGIIKYGERTWALKLACQDKSGSIVAFYYYPVSLTRPIEQEERDEKVLSMACALVAQFKDYIENYDIGRYEFMEWYSKENFLNAMNLDDDTYIGDILEVEMGLMYDLLYTKASATFTKRGCIFRSISFMCTVSVLVGLFRLIAMEVKWNEQHYSMVDIVITGVLLIGALALEIYAVILLLFSDWAMFWLIKCGICKWAIRLLQKFPWFFEKKKWSKKTRQIDLLKEEDEDPKWSNMLERLGIQYKFYTYMHTTSVPIPRTLYPMILQFIYRAAATDNLIDLKGLERFFGFTAFHDQIFIMHIITDIYYRYDDTYTSQNKETCKTLSNYMMYLLLTCRSSLPVVVSDSQLMRFIRVARRWFRKNKIPVQLGERKLSPSEMINICVGMLAIRDDNKIGDKHGRKLELEESMKLFSKEVIIDEGNEEVKWEKLKNVWLAMLCYTAISGPKNYHLQQLREGGELLNLVWLLIPQSHIFCGVDTFTLNGFFNKYFQSMPDVGRARPKNNKGGFSRSYTV